jgi:hypothetical protein
LGTRAKDVLQAYSVIEGNIRPEGSLQDVQQHWQAIEAVVVALKQCMNDNAALKELLNAEFPKQLLATAAASLQRIATAGSSVGPEEPALATASNLMGAIALLFGCCKLEDGRSKLAAAIQSSGEDVRLAGVWLCVMQDRALTLACCCEASTVAGGNARCALRITDCALCCLHLPPQACICTLPPPPCIVLLAFAATSLHLHTAATPMHCVACICRHKPAFAHCRHPDEFVLLAFVAESLHLHTAATPMHCVACICRHKPAFAHCCQPL